jgi:hypothetical protein
MIHEIKLSIYLLFTADELLIELTKIHASYLDTIAINSYSVLRFTCPSSEILATPL